MDRQVVAYSDKVNNYAGTGQHQRMAFQHSLVLLIRLNIQNIFKHTKAKYAARKQKGHTRVVLSWELRIADLSLLN